MSFVAAPPAQDAPPIGDAVAGDGWWPALSITTFRAAIDVPTAVSPRRVAEALLGGFISVDRELAGWRAVQVAAGVTKLQDVPGDDNRNLGGEPRLVVLWRRAVHAYAAADLAESQNDISATNDGRARNEERAAGADEQLRTATVAIRDFLGRRRSRVRLQ